MWARPLLCFQVFETGFYAMVGPDFLVLQTLHAEALDYSICAATPGFGTMGFLSKNLSNYGPDIPKLTQNKRKYILEVQPPTHASQGWPGRGGRAI